MATTQLPAWRAAWAERENDRRRRTHHRDLETWRRRADELTRQRIEALAFLGCTEPRTGLPVDLGDDELVFRILPTAELVEATGRHVPGLPHPALSIGRPTPSSRTLPKGLRVADAGLAVVTNHRVAFAGRALRREWRYADLAGPAHHPDAPVTLLHTSDAGRLAGLLVPDVSVANARFYLTLAVAVARGERAAVVAELDALVEAHERDRPAPPPAADPWQAPLVARRPDRRAAVAVATVAFVTFTASAHGADEDLPQYRAEAGRVVVTDVEPPVVIGAVVPTLAPVPPVVAVPSGGTAGITGGTSDAGSPGDGPQAGGPGEAPAEDSATPARSAAPGAGGGSGRAPVTAPARPPASPTAPPPPAATTPPSSPAPTTPPSTSPPPPAAPSPAPTSPPPSSPDNRLLTVCLDPLRLPLLDPLLCPRDE
ncbi:hypothetical protein D7193_06360 [Micromonospora costi]|uniref:Uncharacterized protein n=1 Tax=Micromonospora costi TaxID=1530042 RepID=A0A3B0AEK5_9ACTN|nr:hypothetical protein D7193_06360 [Micromonospora costi]